LISAQKGSVAIFIANSNKNKKQKKKKSTHLEMRRHERPASHLQEFASLHWQMCLHGSAQL